MKTPSSSISDVDRQTGYCNPRACALRVLRVNYRSKSYSHSVIVLDELQTSSASQSILDTYNLILFLCSSYALLITTHFTFAFIQEAPASKLNWDSCICFLSTLKKNNYFVALDSLVIEYPLILNLLVDIVSFFPFFFHV